MPVPPQLQSVCPLELLLLLLLLLRTPLAVSPGCSGPWDPETGLELQRSSQGPRSLGLPPVRQLPREPGQRFASCRFGAGTLSGQCG